MDHSSDSFGEDTFLVVGHTLLGKTRLVTYELCPTPAEAEKRFLHEHPSLQIYGIYLKVR